MILCSSGVFFERERTDVESILDYGPQLKCDGLEVLVTQRMVPILDETADRLKASGLRFPVVHTPKPVGARLPSIEAVRELEASCRFAREVGAHVAVLHLWDLPQSDRNILERLTAATLAADIASDAGVEIAIETIPCTHATPLTNIERVLEHEPRARVTLDTEFLALHDEMDKLADADWLWSDDVVRHIHIKDFGGRLIDEDGRRRYVVAGEGEIDFPAFFALLDDKTFTGSVALEWAPKNGRTLDVERTKVLLARISKTPWAFTR